MRGEVTSPYEVLVMSHAKYEVPVRLQEVCVSRPVFFFCVVLHCEGFKQREGIVYDGVLGLGPWARPTGEL